MQWDCMNPCVHPWLGYLQSAFCEIYGEIDNNLIITCIIFNILDFVFRISRNSGVERGVPRRGNHVVFPDVGTTGSDTMLL